MLRQFSYRRILFFFALDWLGTLAMLIVAGILRIEVRELPPQLLTLLQVLGIPFWNWPDYLVVDILPIQVYVLVGVIWPFFFLVFSVYDGRRNETLKAELLNVLMSVCIATMTLAGMLYFTYRETSRVLFLIFFILDVLLLLGSRIVFSAVRHSQRTWPPAERRKVIIIGAGPVGCNVVEQLKKYAWADIDVVGYVDDDLGKQARKFEGIPVLGVLDQVPEILGTQHVQAAVVALPLHAHERIVEVCRILQQLSVHTYVIPDLFALSFPSATLDGFGGIPVIDLGRPGIHGWQRFLKRTFDTMAVAVSLVLISPLLLSIAILIKLDSPGPVFYKQLRIGENGRVFTMFKFRSMKPGSDPSLHKTHVVRLIKENLGPEQLRSMGQSSLKMEADPRITRIGKVLRKTSLDELPQLFNVLRGEMSLVGPRPPIDYEVELYRDWHKRRFEAIPGITGLWQVRGRNRVSFDEMVRMDLEYIEHQSLWLDIQILLKTPFAVLTGRGAG